MSVTVPVLRDVAGHHRPAPFYVTSDMFAGVPVELVAAELSALADVPLADLHTHPVPEIYVLLSPVPGEAEIDVEVDGETHRLVSPATFLVPAGARHRFITRRAAPGSWCLGVLLGGENATPNERTS
jgi:quercetin dioxygenase-like cupin family protein